jgi:formylglycine-generating enzyme required for sulfatase activity
MGESKVFEVKTLAQLSRKKKENPTGPATSFDPRDPNTAKHVIKGGFYLCTLMYCMRYRPAARQGQDYTLSTSHIGFRTVL